MEPSRVSYDNHPIIIRQDLETVRFGSEDRKLSCLMTGQSSYTFAESKEYFSTLIPGHEPRCGLN
jgi:hypothetical protein